jgi:hypothetical protein
MLGMEARRGHVLVLHAIAVVHSAKYICLLHNHVASASLHLSVSRIQAKRSSDAHIPNLVRSSKVVERDGQSE